MATHILLIEDDSNIRASLGMLLRQEGYAVSEAESGEDGLRNFNESGADVVLVDLLLPGLDGFEVTRQLRRASEVPVIIVSALAGTRDIVEGLEAGADDYLTKPVMSKELSARIRALMRRSSFGSRDGVALVFGDVENPAGGRHGPQERGRSLPNGDGVPAALRAGGQTRLGHEPAPAAQPGMGI